MAVTPRGTHGEAHLASGWKLICLRVMPAYWPADEKGLVPGYFPGSKHPPDANLPPHVAPTPLSSPAPGEGPAEVTPGPWEQRFHGVGRHEGLSSQPASGLSALGPCPETRRFV